MGFFSVTVGRATLLFLARRPLARSAGILQWEVKLEGKSAAERRDEQSAHLDEVRTMLRVGGHANVLQVGARGSRGVGGGVVVSVAEKKKRDDPLLTAVPRGCDCCYCCCHHVPAFLVHCML